MEMTAKARRRAKELTEKLTLEEKLSLIVETADAVERLGIPKYYHGNEALHGIVRPGKFTVFPQAIAFGAMFDDAFLETIACAVSTEARAKYFYGEKEETELTDEDKKEILAHASALFAGGKLSDEEQLAFIYELQTLYMKARQIIKDREDEQ